MIVKAIICGVDSLFLSMKLKILSLFIVGCLLFTIVSFVAAKSDKSDFESAKEVIIMREISNRVLRYTGDTTSTVLPINRLSENEFEIPFESGFSFKPDSLVRIIDGVISSNDLPRNYIVNVIECNTSKVIFGYAILGVNQKNIVPCLGRQQPNKRYCINIKFEESSWFSRNLYLVGLSLLSIGLVFWGVQRFKKEKPVTEQKSEEMLIIKTSIQFGKFAFYAEELLLVFESEKIPLTIKEAKLLSIFAANLNQIVDRNRLQKEVWEDEGVIVGRSLDMFISKLRKKLEQDPAVKLTNIHGKGYKLEV
ncbi:MAG: helix-turn-helix domain-containing protein [Emticicia sp.]